MKFNISHVGKIESAEIEIKPLTIFIGQNNSGKLDMVILMGYSKLH